MLLVLRYFEHGVDLVYGLVVVRARGDDVLAGVEAGRVAADHQQRRGQGAPHQHLGVLAERVLDQSEVRIWSRDLAQPITVYLGPVVVQEHEALQQGGHHADKTNQQFQPWIMFRL